MIKKVNFGSPFLFITNFSKKQDIYSLNKEIMKKIIRLTESDLARIVKRVIKENQEMEEGIFGDLGKGLKRIATGYGDTSEKDAKRDQLRDELDAIPEEDVFYNDWEGKKDDLMRQAEEDNYRGRWEIVGNKDKFVRWVSRYSDPERRSGIGSPFSPGTMRESKNRR